MDQPQQPEDTVREIRQILAAVKRSSPANEAVEPITETQAQRICYWFTCLEFVLNRHLDVLHDGILSYPALPVRQMWLDLDHHWEASEALSTIREITWRTGVGPGRPRGEVVPPPFDSQTVLGQLSILRISAQDVILTFNFIQQDFLEVEATNPCCWFHVRLSQYSFATWHYSLMCFAFNSPEARELLFSIGFTIISESLLDLESFLLPIPLTALPPSPPPPVSATRQDLEHATCFVCWLDCNEIPYYEENSIISGIVQRLFPDGFEATGSRSMVQPPCCAAVFHKVCMFQTIISGRHICAHCQQPLPWGTVEDLLHFKATEFVRKALLLREDIREERSTQ